jgi:4-carboxymuconolactone decarboxylase
MDRPRIAPAADLPPDVAAKLATTFGDGEPLNIFRTLAKAPKMLESVQRMGGFLLSGKGIPPREREIVVLRVGWRAGSEYEFGQHTVIGREAGLTDEEILRLTEDGLDGWDDGDRLLVALADDLHADDKVDDRTWIGLAERWTEPQLIELLVLAGFYRLISGFLNSTGVQLEPGTPGWPTS